MGSRGSRGLRPLVGWAAVAIVAVSGCALLDGRDEPDEPEFARGEALYATHCIDCHGGATGGDIADIPPPHNAQGHTWHHGDCELVEWTLEGLPRRPGLPPDTPAMPAFADRLDEDDVRAILAYVKTWWMPEQREHQAAVTAQVCR
jgi:mono/diheme cytochrome c family protein